MPEILHHPWALPVAFLLASLVAWWVTRTIVLNRLAAVFAKTRTTADDLILAAVRRHLPIWFLLGGVAAAAHAAPIAPSTAEIVRRAVVALLVLSASFATASLAGSLLQRRSALQGSEIAGTSLGQNILRVIIVALGGLMVLSNLGISITPLLTALGVGSLAVALALQPTLANLFAGMHISIAKPIRIGDFVKLESGAQGFVEDIGWRAIRIRELPNNIIIVPNSRIADMIITNYAMPETEQSALVQMGVAYGSDLEKVERVVIEVAREVLATVQGGMAGFDPFIRYHTFGNSSIDFSVILRVQTFVDRYLVTHEFVKRVKARFDREGIEIPFPQRVVHIPGALRTTPEVPAGSPGGR